MAYTRVNWENGTKTREGYVIVDGEVIQTVQPEYSGNTPVNANNLNIMDEQIKKISDYIDARYKVLWTGTWTTGDLTIDGLSNYNSIIVYVDTAQDPIVCYKCGLGTYYQGATILGNASSPNEWSKVFRCSINANNANKITWDYAKELGHNGSGNHGSASNKTVYKIVGLDPII